MQRWRQIMSGVLRDARPTDARHMTQGKPRRAGLAQQARRVEINHPVQPHRPQVRDPQRDLPSDVAKRVAPLVAVHRRIRQFAAADAVEDDQENTRERSQACWAGK